METREERAAGRSSWRIRRIDLIDEGAEDDLSSVTTPEERLGMVEALSEEAYPSITTYPRRESPGRVIRPPR